MKSSRFNITFLPISIFARVIMADLPTDLTDFLQNHPFLQVTEAKKVGSLTICSEILTFAFWKCISLIDMSLSFCTLYTVCVHSSLIGIFTTQIKCTLNGHEFPCILTELKNFTSGKKYKKLSAIAEFDYSQYEPHVVPSTKEP